MEQKGVQADFPQLLDTSLKRTYIRPAERIELAPKVPPEPSAYGKYSNYSRPWILQDGRELKVNSSECKDKYRVPVDVKPEVGIRRRLLRNFLWEQMLEEVMDDLKSSEPVAEYCTEYSANYVRGNFQPKPLEISKDKNLHIRYPLYGTGSSAITFYSENIKKQGPGEILEKFRSCQFFSKPMGERLDNGWVL